MDGHLGRVMTSAGSGEVRGRLYTSTIGLAIALALAMGAALAVMRGLGILHSTHQAVGLWAMSTVLLTVMLQIANSVTVSSEGFLLSSFGRTVWIPWTNVSHIDAGLLGATFVLKEPQSFGYRPKRRYTFACLDPKWSKRPTLVAVAAQLSETHPNA